MQSFKPGSEHQYAIMIIWLSNIDIDILSLARSDSGSGTRTALLHRPAGDANLMYALHVPYR